MDKYFKYDFARFESYEAIETLLSEIQEKTRETSDFTAVVDIVCTQDQIQTGQAARTADQIKKAICALSPAPRRYFVSWSDETLPGALMLDGQYLYPDEEHTFIMRGRADQPQPMLHMIVGGMEEDALIDALVFYSNAPDEPLIWGIQPGDIGVTYFCHGSFKEEGFISFELTVPEGCPDAMVDILRWAGEDQGLTFSAIYQYTAAMFLLINHLIQSDNTTPEAAARGGGYNGLYLNQFGMTAARHMYDIQTCKAQILHPSYHEVLEAAQAQDLNDIHLLNQRKWFDTPAYMLYEYETMKYLWSQAGARLLAGLVRNLIKHAAMEDIESRPLVHACVYTPSLWAAARQGLQVELGRTWVPFPQVYPGVNMGSLSTYLDMVGNHISLATYQKLVELISPDEDQDELDLQLHAEFNIYLLVEGAQRLGIPQDKFNPLFADDLTLHIPETANLFGESVREVIVHKQGKGYWCLTKPLNMLFYWQPGQKPSSLMVARGMSWALYLTLQAYWCDCREGNIGTEDRWNSGNGLAVLTEIARRMKAIWNALE